MSLDDLEKKKKRYSRPGEESLNSPDFGGKQFRKNRAKGKRVTVGVGQWVISKEFRLEKKAGISSVRAPRLC